jgi:hypothetical protein
VADKYTEVCQGVKKTQQYGRSTATFGLKAKSPKIKGIVLRDRFQKC